MKIGILTFHRAHNYGAVLQCYALQEILKGKGHDVQVIDYRQPWIEEFYRLFSMKMLLSKSGPAEAFGYIKGNLKKFIKSPGRKRFFSDFRNRHMDLSDRCDAVIPQDFDCYIIGSDQLWSLHCLGGNHDAIFLGDFSRPSGSRLVGYAISADAKSVDALGERLKEILPAFNYISMREAEIARRVGEYSGLPCSTCLDPTLLTDASLWKPLFNDRWKKRKYVLMYEVRWNKDTKGLLRKKAEELAARIGDGCEVIDVSRMRYPVDDFVSLFRYARYVVTTSFHGIVFSILFRRPFYALPLWNGYDLRYKELLENLGVHSRLVAAETELVPDDIDFGPVAARLEDLRKGSLDYIDKSLA